MKANVHFIIDEAAALGHMDCIDDAVDKMRGYGVKLFFCFQSVGQLGKCFPKGQEQTLLSNVTQIFLQVNDNDSAKMVSDRLGQETIVVDGGNRSSNASTSRSFGRDLSTSNSSSRNSTSSWQQQARKLLNPDEVMALDPRLAIIFTPGVPPICTKPIRYYKNKNLGKPSNGTGSVLDAVGTLIFAAVFCAVALASLGFVVIVSDRWDEARNRTEMTREQ